MDHVLITKDFDFDGYYSPFFQATFGFALGLILAPFSVGLFIFIVLYFVFELFYAYRRGFWYTPAEILVRFSIFLIGLLGFITGRLLSGDDNPWRVHYDTWDLSDFSTL